MQWSDVTAAPSAKMLRQFAGLFLVVFFGLAAWRWLGGQPDSWAIGLGVAALVVGLGGLATPVLVRPIYTGWMILAFPIGWTVSRVLLGLVFFVVIMPLAWLFRSTGRDPLQLRREKPAWIDKVQASGPRDYFRQF